MRFRLPTWLHLLAAVLLLHILVPSSAWAQTRVVDLTAARPAVAGTAITHYRANPLTLRVALDATRPTLTGKEKLVVEVRRSVLDTTTALVRQEIANPQGGGPFDVPVTGAQLNQPLEGLEKKSFWLVVYTLGDSGETLDVLATAPLVLREHGASLTAAAPPNVVGVLTQPAADALYASISALSAEAASRTAALTAETMARVAADDNRAPLASPIFTGTLTAPDATITTLRIGAATPDGEAATGTPGTIRWDSNNIYICVATNTWKRAPLLGFTDPDPDPGSGSDLTHSATGLTHNAVAIQHLN